MSSEALRRMSPLKLAYLGDAVYDMHVRYYLTLTLDIKVNELHKTATRYVKASAQAMIFHAVQGLLSEDEKSIMLRGRNQKTKTVAKNATVTDYRSATGFETLIGYLALSQQHERLHEIIRFAIDVVEGKCNSEGVVCHE